VARKITFISDYSSATAAPPFHPFNRSFHPTLPRGILQLTIHVPAWQIGKSVPYQTCTAPRFLYEILVHYGKVLDRFTLTADASIPNVELGALVAMARAACDPAPMQPLQSSQVVRPAMVAPRRLLRARGISLVEMMFVITIIILLAVLILATMSRARNSANGLVCLSNLKAIHTALMTYASYNGERFPPTRDVAKRNWESLISPYIGPSHAFQCPADSDIFPNIGSSYDWRDLPDDKATLAGKAATGPLRQDRILAFETLPGWHCRHKISVVRLNGKAEPLDENQCFNDLDAPVKIQASRSQ
jgi:type II secretory pathway pseudopilin PulG